MIEKQLCASLDRRAGAFLDAARSAADPHQLRTAAIVGASATVARSHGIAGVEGYLVALNELGTSADGLAVRAIRQAIDEAIVTVATAAWTGGLAALRRTTPSSDRSRVIANAA
jgi:fatty acid/phospholipid biosynthesis enzyme